ncbi:MAG: hypothetical protein QGI88_11125 [SAR202 cluster bacterium]|nr:hypothetical protein [SAR202 cluster bacterium]
MNRIRRSLAFGLLAMVLAVGVQPVYAHGFGQRYDLPVPLNLFLLGAAATVAFSFVIIGIFVRVRPGDTSYPRLNLLKVPVLGATISHLAFAIPIRLLALALFVLVVSTSLFGTSQPIANLSPTFVWIIWWVGMGYVAALVGNIWRDLNPWKISYEWVRAAVSRGEEREPPLVYPEEWGSWPAVALFVSFAWVENVYAGAAQPFRLGILILMYSAVTWAGMAAFGKHAWLKHGETFTVLFGFFARFSPTEVRVANDDRCHRCSLECGLGPEGCVDCYECFEYAAPGERELNLRPYAVGLALPQRVSTSVAAFVVLALATVTFDGFQDTSTWAAVQSNLGDWISEFGGDPEGLIDTFGLVVVPLLFMAVYLGFSWAIARLSGGKSNDDETFGNIASTLEPVARSAGRLLGGGSTVGETFRLIRFMRASARLLGGSSRVGETARIFVFSLVPIALAYNLAHFISLLAIQGQLIIPLVSDPFGFGWDLFGTVDYTTNLNAVNAKFVWYISVVAIVLGHIVSVYVAHVIALRTTPDHAKALKGQYPMLALMVIYTVSSLWIIGQPIVE